MFTHLHVHTEYSLLDGMCHIPQLVQRAKELGMKSLAITDHGALYGVIQFYLQAKAAGIKPIIGCEFYLAQRERHSKTPADKHPYHLILLARNEVGYHNLIQLSTRAHLEGFYYRPRVDRELLTQHSEGLIALSACLFGEIERLLLERRHEEAERAALWYRDAFPDFYIELQKHTDPELKAENRELLVALARNEGINIKPDDIPTFDELNREQVAIARKLGIPIVASNDVHYVHREDAPLHEVLVCIQTNSVISDRRRNPMSDDSFYLKSAEEMAELFPHYPEALENTERIAEMCQLELEFGKLHFPEVELPAGRTADEYLAELCWRGLSAHYRELSAEVEGRLKYELEVIRQTNFANYFLVVWDVTSFARQRGILFGVRGSAAASLVLYCLGVTDIDPLAHNLVFERFLNVERREMPDIDLDFQDDRRDEVIHYLAHKYGSERVAQIVTFGTLGARAALRDVGRVLGLPYAQVDRVVRLVPPAPTITIAEALAENSELRGLYQSDEVIRELIDTASKLEGTVRHASTHAAGVVISKEPLIQHLPLARPSRGGDTDLATTQFAMDDIATIGLLKMDFLGLANLTILNEAKKLIAQTKGVDIDLDNIPLDDAKTFELLSSAQTAGVFQLEGAGMRRYIKELRPSSFPELAAMVALYRPGPKQQLPVFINAKHGRQPIHFPHPALADILKETYGVIVYQDQVLLIVQAFAGYSLGQADVVRKAMGKKIPEIMAREREGFLAGAEGKGFSRKVAEDVFALIAPFAGYAFNKAHAVSYAMLAYKTAYLKANHPVEFMAALLTINMENQDKVASAVAECHRLGIPVLGPDVNKSEEAFSVEVADGGAAIRFGLGAIKNVGGAAIRPIIAARHAGGAFNSIDELCRRGELQGLNRRALESLIKAGALDSLGDRGALLGGVERILALAQRGRRLRETGQATMFDLWGESVAVPLPELELSSVEVPASEKAAWEQELLGVSLSQRPLGSGNKKPPPEVDVFCGQIDEEMAGQIVVTAGQLMSVRQLFTKSGRPFVSAVLGDVDGSIEVTVWSEVFERTKELWVQGQELVVKGRVKLRGDRVQLVCQSATPYREREPQPPRRHLQITIAQSADAEADIARLRDGFNLLQGFPGEDTVHLTIEDGSGATKLAVPQLTTGYCPELHDRLVQLVGEAGLNAG